MSQDGYSFIFNNLTTSNNCICFICTHFKKQTKKKVVDFFFSRPLIGLVGECHYLRRVSPFSCPYVIQKKKQVNSSSQTIISFGMILFYSGENLLQIFKHISFNIDLAFSVWNKKYPRVHTSRCYNNTSIICTMAEFIFSCNL